VVPTADVAERVFADLLYYLEEDEPRTVRLLRSREETVGAIESPSERSARMALLAELADGAPGIVLAPSMRCANTSPRAPTFKRRVSRCASTTMRDGMQRSSGSTVWGIAAPTS
jgi:hypothetical protein